MRIINKLSKKLIITIGIISIVSLGLIISIGDRFIITNSAHGSMVAGGSGSLAPGSPETSIAGIESTAYREPPFRISLFRGKGGYLENEGGIDNIFNKMAWGYPENITGSIHFLNPTAYNLIDGRPVSIASANTANGTLDYYGDNESLSNIIKMTSPRSMSGVYYNSIKTFGIDSYRDGGWKTTSWQYDNCYSVWSYILQKVGGTYYIKDRIDEVFNPNRVDFNNLSQYNSDQMQDIYMHYLDFLMSLYTVTHGSVSSQWETAIDNYLSGDNLEDSPVTVDIDSEVLMTLGSSYLMLPVVDYFNYYAGISPAYQLDGESWWSGSVAESNYYKNDTYEQLRAATQLSVNNSPNFARISDRYVKANGFSFATSSFGSKALFTSGGTAEWKPWGNATSKYMELTWLSNASVSAWQYGYMLVPMPTSEPDLKAPIGMLTATPDNKVIETQNIGLPVTLTVSSGVTDSTVGIWNTIVEKAKKSGDNFVVTFTPKKVYSNVNTPAMFNQPAVKVTWTPSEMGNFINGTTNITIIDNTAGINITGQKSIDFTYLVDINISVGKKEYNGSATDTASFKVLEPRIGYSSKPDAYSELKNYGEGSNEDGTLKEDYEAMAGVPSTEQLYFAAGGSEFIVEITVERIEDEVAKRTYSSYYSGVDCEFKDGDTAKPVNFPSQPGATGASTSGDTYWDPHQGKNFDFTWTGSIPNLAQAKTTNGKGNVSSTCVAIPDMTSFNAALAAAQAYVNTVNNTTFSWTAASDRITRSKNQWGARISTNVKNLPQNVTEKDSFFETDDKGRDKPVSGSVTANPSGPGNYTIKVTWSIEPHVICGPCDDHVLPSISDTWAQTWSYDSMKITDVHVWTIDQASVDGLKKIISTDVVGADIVKGRPNIFYNIALKNDPQYVAQDGLGGATGTSGAGRVRYSLDSAQHDTVVYNNGVRTNKCDGLAYTYPNNVVPAGGKGHNETYATGLTYEAFRPGHSVIGAQWETGQRNYPTNEVGYLQGHTDNKDKQTVEYNKFLSQRNAQVTPTMITDFLILQTSSGDQSVMYFHKTSTPVTSESQMIKQDTSNEDMWDNNSYSAAKWSEDHINVGGYNGKYKKPEGKFSVNSKGNQPNTFFDSDPAGTIKRPARPNTNLMLYKGELNIILEDTNKSYSTGQAEVFWKNTLHWTDRSSDRFKNVTDPTSTASFPTNMTVGELTKYNFASPVDTKLGDYTINNGLRLRDGTTNINGSAYTNNNEQGVFGPYVPVVKGRYKVDVYGSGLNNGKAVIYTDYGGTNWSSLVTYETRTDTHVTYYVDIPSATSILEFCWHADNAQPMRFDSESVTLVGYTDPDAKGYIKKAPYSDEHAKINNIIVHDPVSVQDSSLVSLPNSRDQRTGDIKGTASDVQNNINDSQVCPRDPALCDFRVLNCTYFEDTVLAEFNFDRIDSKGRPINSITNNALTLPNGFSISNGKLDARGTRLAIPFSELNLSYQPSVYLKVSADITMNQLSRDTMIFSFQQFDLYVPANQPYVTLNTGNGVERQITIPIADGQTHHIEVTFNFNTVDHATVTVDGREGYRRVNTSEDLNSSIIGSNFYIGSWGANNSYPANFVLDNLKITRLAGVDHHTDDCYKEIEVHPNGLNAHQHTAECLDRGDGGTGGQWFVNGVVNGSISDNTAHDILGNAYEPVMANSFGPIIYTWDGWSPNNMLGFVSDGDTSIYGVNGNIIANNYGNDPRFSVPVDISASAVTKIQVYLDTKAPNIASQMYWELNSSSPFSESQSVYGKVSADGQTVDFVVRNSGTWNGKITKLRFDLGVNGQSVNVGMIRIYGNGDVLSYGSGSENKVVFQSDSPGSYPTSVGSGVYTIETWGAKGGVTEGYNVNNNGAYAKTRVTLNSDSTLYANVGGIGQNSSNQIDRYEGNKYVGGFNGGGTGSGSAGPGGGGASDVRINSNNEPSGNSWGNLLLIAGGGAGTGKDDVPVYGRGVTSSNISGRMLYGENGDVSRHAKKYPNDEGGGGGGYYGGATVHGDDGRAGYGGTSYINSGDNQAIISGDSTMPSPYGGTEVGHGGNGYVRITAHFTPIQIANKGSNGVAEGTPINFGYTGGVQSINLPAGDYRIETWGAQGGNNSGNGGYSVGTVSFGNQTIANVYVGGQGTRGVGGTLPGGFNGGGSISSPYSDGNNGTGGGASDVRIGGNNLGNRVIVAGGGGGTVAPTTVHGAGGGVTGITGIGAGKNTATGGTQTSGGTGLQANGTLGNGGTGIGNGVRATGGGGYYGGGTTTYAGGGGSGYVGGVSNGQTIAGDSTIPNPNGGVETGHRGNGYVRITPINVDSGKAPIVLSLNDVKAYWYMLPERLPNGAVNPIWGCRGLPYNIHVHDRACHTEKVLVCSEPHHKGMHYDVSSTVCWQPCYNDENHKHYKPTINTTDGTFTPGNFVNMDYGFKIYYPNQGDFGDGEPYGIGGLTSQRGLGFTDSMDTTKWTKTKKIKFKFNVIYNGNLYKSGEWITLGDRGTYKGSKGSKYNEAKWSNYGKDIYDDIDKDYYEFYCVLANYEAKSASIEVITTAVNCKGESDNTEEDTNKNRGKYSALHGAYRQFYADVVGRIGNLTLEDTGDYRFSNLFKTPSDKTSTNDKTNKYNAESGLYGSNGSERSGNSIILKGSGQKAYVDGISASKGAYQIVVDGTDLDNGSLVVSTGTSPSIDWTNNLQVKSQSNSSVTYTLDIPYDSSMTVSYKSSKGSLVIDTISTLRIGISSEKWAIEGIVRDVDESKQNYYLTWSKDIRGLDISSKTNYINTYNTLNWIDEKHLPLPLSVDDNNIDIIKNQGQQLVVGYPIYFDISSLGNYWWNNSSKLQVTPYYYAFNPKTQEKVPLDVYFKYDEEYQPVNVYDLVKSNWNGSGVYNYVISLDWLHESVRRNYTDIEKAHTDFFRDYYAEGKVYSNQAGDMSAGDASHAVVVAPKQLDAPGGSKYVLGNAQFMNASGKARTFIGGETTYGELKNLGGKNKVSTDSNGALYNAEGRISNYLWWQSAQRWHLKVALPSSAVFVRHGVSPDSQTITEFTNENYVILCTANMTVVGDTYALKYTQDDNGTVYFDGVGHVKMPTDVPPILAVYSSTKSSAIDVDIVKTH